MPSVSTRKATLEARLLEVQAAISATLTRGVAGYSTEIQSITSMKLKDLRDEEQSILNELRRLERGTRFGGVGFKNPS